MDAQRSLRERFEDWLKAQTPPMSQSAFARCVPMSESHLSLVLDGKRPISLRKAAKIENLTGIPIRAFVAVVGLEPVGEAAQ